MSSARYAPLPNPHTDPSRDEELEAAFDDSDDEDQDSPVTTRNGAYRSLPNDEPVPSQPDSPQRTHHQAAGTYDFENVDYDFPPPGSPPRRDRALPGNDWVRHLYI